MDAVAAKPQPRSRQPLIWALARVPLVLALFYALRAQLIDLIEATVDIVGITTFVIDLMGTPLARAGLAIVLTLIFFVIAKASERFSGRLGYLIALGACAAIAAIVTTLGGGGMKASALVIILLASNWAPLSVLAHIGLSPRWLERLIAIPPGVAEGLFTSRYMDWVTALVRGEGTMPYTEQPRKLPGALIAATAVAVLISGASLVPLERAARAGPDVRMFATGDFNGLAYDQATQRVFATGHGAERILSYDAKDLKAAPLAAQVPTGMAQGLAYDPASEQIYVYNYENQSILVLDARMLALNRTIAAPDLSPGDPWIALDPISDTITVVSEADQQVGSPFIVFDRKTGAALAKSGEDAGNVLVHPTKPILYLSFFRRGGSVSAYDLKARKIIATAPTDSRMDRMTFDPVHNEVLIASPAEGRFLQFDADTLAPKGGFKAIFGARVLDIDLKRRVMLTGSLATGKVALMGLDDRKVLRTWYLGPWLRSIVIAPDRGVAYVSSQGNLYELRYASGS